MEKITASKLGLADSCPASFSLPHVQREDAAASKGTAIHEFIAAFLSDGLLEPDKVEDRAARRVCEGIDPHELWELAGDHLGDLRAEIAFAYDPASGDAEMIEGAAHRDYSGAPDGWVCGTADAVWVGEDAVLVTDWKTGGPVAAPEHNPQLGFLALCAARAFGKERAVVRIAYVDGGGGLTASDAELSPEDLRETEERIQAISRRVEESREGGPAAFRVGSHCRRCPAFSSCPAQAGAAQALMGEKLDELTPGKAAEIWERLRAVEAATKKVREALTSYVAAYGAAPLRDGGELRVVESKREKIDPSVALPLLRALYGEEGADRAVSVSKTALKKIAGEELGGIMAEIERAGGVETSHSESLREVSRGR